MSYEIEADYEQSYLLPPAVEDWIPANHPARFIREFVDNLDLEALGFRVRKSNMGAPNYSSSLLVKVWVYGWLERIRNFRPLEKACRQHMGLIWLTGQHYPDHNTLWRFWRDNQKGLRALFRKSVEVAWEIDLVSVVLHAVDGTKMPAASSRRSALHREDLEKLLKKVDEQIEAMSQQLAAQSPESSDTGYELPEEMTTATALRERVRNALKQLDAAGVDQIHPKEPEARIMKTPGRKEWSYNAQAVADESSCLIVAADVVNCETDNDQLVRMIDQVKENLGCVAECTVADAGYANAEQLQQADERGIDVVANIADPGEAHPYHRSHFTYDEKHDQWICPQNHRLDFVAEVTNRGTVYRRYAGGDVCSSCPVHKLCTKQKQRRLDVPLNHLIISHHRDKRKEVGYQDALNRRKAIIEPRFGWVKQAFGMRRWTVRGTEKVKTQWLTICTVWNLQRMWKLIWGDQKPRIRRQKDQHTPLSLTTPLFSIATA